MASIFISYRRDDSIDITGRIFDRIIGRFGKGIVFKDVDSLIGGQNFPEVLRESIQHNTVMLVVIGRSWLGTTQARANDPNDYARIEIETALQRRATIIPVLIQGAQMPRREQLPPSIAELANHHATIVRPDPDFSPDMNGVVRAIAPHMRSVGQRVARIGVPLGTLVILAVVAALIAPRFINQPITPTPVAATCNAIPVNSTTVKDIGYTPAKVEGIHGQAIHVVGSGNAEQGFFDIQPLFDEVNGTCTQIDRGGGGWLIKDSNEVGVTDFSTNYDTRSRDIGKKLTDHYLAILPEVVIVGDAVYKRGIHNLSRENISDIFAGVVTDWRQIDGGPSVPIDVFRRTDNQTDNNISGISLTFAKTILQGGNFKANLQSADGSEAALQKVAGKPYSISYIALQAVNFYSTYQAMDHPVTINSYAPSLATIEGGQYEFWDFVHAYTLPSLDEKSAIGKAIHALLQTLLDRKFQGADFASSVLYPVEIDRLKQSDQDCRTNIDPCFGT